jgi:inner membrane protein
MDTISQAALGVFTTDTFCRRALGPKNIAIGMAAGILPDLDVIVPQIVELAGGNFYLTYLSTHRTWSHSLVMAPLLALLLAAACTRLRLLRGLRFSWMFLAAWLGIVTHILLDLCTSYGIELFWPLSRHRFAMYWVPEIDLFMLPLFSLIMLAIFLRNARRRPTSARLSWIGLAIFGGYVALGAVLHHIVWQRFESTAAQSTTAIQTRREVFPHLGSLMVWRVVEVSNEQLKITRFEAFADGPMESSEVVNQNRELPPWLVASSSYATLHHAASGFLWVQKDTSVAGDQRFVMQDVRFALSPTDANGLIALAASRNSQGEVSCEVQSWFWGKSFLGKRTYAQATALLWQNIF